MFVLCKCTYTYGTLRIIGTSFVKHIFSWWTCRPNATTRPGRFTTSPPSKVRDLQRAAVLKDHSLTSIRNDFAGRLENEVRDLSSQLDEAENQVVNLNRLKSQLNAQLKDAKRVSDDESRVRSVVISSHR